jgi:hypothetical protein
MQASQMALKKKSTRLGALSICFVDKSMEISNFSITPRDLIDTHHIMTLIMN